MNNGFAVLEKYLMKPMAKISQLKIVRAVMAAGVASIPFTIVGSMFLVLNVLPLTFPFLNGFFNNTFYRFSDLYMLANASTMGILALYFGLVIGYELTRIEETESKLNVNPLNGALLSLFAFFLCVPELLFNNGKMALVNSITDTDKVISGLRIGDTIQRLGTSGIFTAIIMAVIAVKLYCLCVRRNWIIKMPDTVPPGVSRAFTALIPAFAIAFVVLIINGTLVLLGTDIFKMVAIPFAFVTYLTNSWLGICVIYFIISALWIVGIHGANIVSAFATPIVLANMQANIHGANIPFAGEFQNSFVFMGGSGATLGLILFITFIAKSEQLKVLGRASIVPGLFNINEPIIFGLPIVYNPYLAIPFFLAPITSASIAYFAIKLKIVLPIIAQVPWPTPIGLGAFIGTAGDWKAIILAIICATAAFLIYFPFIKYYDAKLVKDEQKKTAEMDTSI
ncbi:PTS cellobiose transporter subunit IIC [Sporolactobacillus sp. STSJ-5]|uniref:PTS cellobiose transporter subunit IIC n=1 Tax=Sporolactobacillus sp. STSJ-5 TaxID=2965076 RepID=UPI0021037312|nr:PTS cellobiose transporter subunit IIC [Sporolactobacillus sp. STSJ-5]MCQ2010961.1 PTS cellobiose transporter subunit IIC [Sporolactobacillus sp. STSJ-5]